ncbi:DNA-dependent metalloprotease SPRTN-like isoform X2 [Portunus trituberculatus]|uniref:DNA-dependent metalloprotease SPRTN-like isoform X2 n=1 Tax=Portunus trituberculatus TaxID=210409 RepID=UPI001E1CCC24|nr:DNA-dependent metalloprotease SPRTN-like isoform X2 [Portunus trituberculatus]
MSEIDLTLALQLQAQFEEELRVSLLKQQEEKNKQKNEGTSLFLDFQGTKKIKNPLGEPQQEKLSLSLIDPSWELIDPNPDIHTLFLVFNDQFFWGRLAGVEVRWSPRMTLCAGVCCYEGRGGLCSVRLSLPLLKLRPRKDLIETLLVYHSFHDEVDVYRQHIWQCNGPCRTRRPYFGLVKRSMNRAPGPNDNWWAHHQQTCGGTYAKIQEPDRSGATKKGSQTASKTKADGCSDIRKYIGFTGKSNSLGGTTSKAVHSKDQQVPVEINKTRNSEKENTPVGGVRRKIENESKHNLGETKEKHDKVRGFASTSSGVVNQVKVNGASHSNVHGFGSHSPARKKPCGGNGIAAEKMPGSKNMVKRNTGGSGTTGVAVRGSGSRTVTVKGKTGTQTETQVKASTSEPSYTAFQGQGHALGGGTTSMVSRLLIFSDSNSLLPSTSLETKLDSESGFHMDTELDQRGRTSPSSVSSAEDNVTKKCQKSLDCYVITPSSSESVRKTVRCPVCNVSVLERDINKHLDDCVGNSSDEDVMKDASKEKSCKGMSPTNGEVVMCIEDNNINESINSGEHSQAGLQTSNDVEREQYPCPVCGECCSPATINQHLDTHF